MPTQARHSAVDMEASPRLLLRIDLGSGEVTTATPTTTVMKDTRACIPMKGIYHDHLAIFSPTDYSVTRGSCNWGGC